MSSLNFSVAEVARTAAVGGLVTIPVIFIFGSLSDKFGRRRFLSFGYLLGAVGALILISADQLWQFWAATALIFIARSTDGTVAPAMATDLRGTVRTLDPAKTKDQNSTWTMWKCRWTTRFRSTVATEALRFFPKGQKANA